MENIEILVLTGIIFTLFALFIIGPLFYAHQISQTGAKKMDSTSKDYNSQKKIEALNHIYQDILSEPNLSKKEKSTLTKIMNRTIADMESDGVYFPKALPNNHDNNAGENILTDKSK